MGLKLRSVSLNLPFGLGGVQVDISEAEARAAWNLYVEYATRITVQPLEPGSGSVREALDSIYTLFATTRQVLSAAGPEVADSANSLGPLAIRILNEGVRPFLVAWHTELLGTRAGEGKEELPPERRAAFDLELAQFSRQLDEYVKALGALAGIRP